MFAGMRPRPTYANVVSTIALFGVLGGGAYAAQKITSNEIAKNAIRAKHIKENAVGTPKIADGAVSAAKLAAGVEGLQGPQGAPGSQGPSGPQGDTGPAGLPGTSVFASTIPSGTTVRGAFGDTDTATDTDNSASVRGAVSFPVPAPANLSNEQVNFASGLAADDDATCTGSGSAPTAPAGKVCLYVDDFSGQTGSLSGLSINPGTTASRFGFAFTGIGDTANPSRMILQGTWAYTAP